MAPPITQILTLTLTLVSNSNPNPTPHLTPNSDTNPVVRYISEIQKQKQFISADLWWSATFRQTTATPYVKHKTDGY